jgi:hypothetical protein
MHNISLEQMQKRISELTPTVRNLLFSPETTKIIMAIGQRARLMVDKVGDLSEEISLVIMGFVSTKDFVNNLTTKLEIDPADAKQIAADVNEQIFSKIREEMMKMNGDEGMELEVAVVTAPPTDLGNLKGLSGGVGSPKGLSGGIIGSPKDQLGGVVSQTPANQIAIIATPPVPLIPPVGEASKPAIIAPSAVPALQITGNQQLTTAPRADLGNPEGLPLGNFLTPFEQKLKEDAVFSAPAVISQHEAPSAGIKNQELGIKEGMETEKAKPPLPTKTEIKYGGQDPYRESTE